MIPVPVNTCTVTKGITAQIVTLSSCLAYGIRHSRAALPNRLFVAGRGVLRGLMLDLRIQFRAYEYDD